MRDMRSHLISQVVLRRFADGDDKIVVHNLRTGQSELKSIYDTAYRDVDSNLISKLECHPPHILNTLSS